ncbi:hypothetical protein [Chitinophaga agri]|uniref:DUF4468 domain-containing protein n=1 Tax=Chitinophaga agri TaxID=2703787 RepID=A0A6B9ZD62_9BACT|nr:hypothetical protein [Chitinophaga agri]QHS58443.1 hypothetical protein GWR21_02180 [Chitinophaga agri]
MKKKLLIPALVVLAWSWPSITVSGQQKTSVKIPTASEADIKSIRAEFQKINTLKLAKEEINYEGLSCAPEGRIQCFTQGQDILKIVDAGAAGDGSWTTEYYFREGKFFFSYEVIVGSSADGQDSRIEHRIYVKNGKIIRYLENQQEIPADSSADRTLAIAAELYNVFHNNLDYNNTLLEKIFCK